MLNLTLAVGLGPMGSTPWNYWQSLNFGLIQEDFLSLFAQEYAEGSGFLVVYIAKNQTLYTLTCMFVDDHIYDGGGVINTTTFDIAHFTNQEVSDIKYEVLRKNNGFVLIWNNASSINYYVLGVENHTISYLTYSNWTFSPWLSHNPVRNATSSFFNDETLVTFVLFETLENHYLFLNLTRFQMSNSYAFPTLIDLLKVINIENSGKSLLFSVNILVLGHYFRYQGIANCDPNFYDSASLNCL